MRPHRRKTPSPEKKKETDAERWDREQRTILIYQLHPKIDDRHLFEFFSLVGQVDDIRLIRDAKSQKSKGLCYVEFHESEAANKALALNGQLLNGYPVAITVTQSEKNAAPTTKPQSDPDGAMRLYVGSLHYNVTEDDIRPLFEAFGPLDSVKLERDPGQPQSKGFGFVQFQYTSHAKAAMEKLNGLEIGGRPMKVSDANIPTAGGYQLVNDHGDRLDDEMDSGKTLSASARSALMARLAGAAPTFALQPQPKAVFIPTAPMTQPSTCIVIKNMFDPATETEARWDEDIRDDVSEEVKKCGDLKHIHVDKKDPGGLVYIRMEVIEAAQKVISNLNGRWFASRQLSVSNVPEATYLSMFPKAK